MSQDPRAQVREMIADVLGELEPCRHVARDGTCYECAAGEVMELFPEVWQHHTASGPCYVLRTAPTGDGVFCADEAEFYAVLDAIPPATKEAP